MLIRIFQENPCILALLVEWDWCRTTTTHNCRFLNQSNELNGVVARGSVSDTLIVCQSNSVPLGYLVSTLRVNFVTQDAEYGSVHR